MEATIPRQIVDDLLKLAWVSRLDGNWEHAGFTLENAMAMCHEHSLNSRMARCLAYQGQIDHDKGDLESAIAHYRQARDIYHSQDASRSAIHVTRHIADLQRESGALEPALANYQHVIAHHRSSETTDGLDLANALRGLALLYEEMKDPQLAREVWLETRSLYASHGIHEGVEECDTHLNT